LKVRFAKKLQKLFGKKFSFQALLKMPIFIKPNIATFKIQNISLKLNLKPKIGSALLMNIQV